MHPLLFLACIKYIYNEKKDFLSALSEFVIGIIADYPEIEISPEKISEKFSEVYHLQIPFIPMEELLTRIHFQGFLEFDKNSGKWLKTSQFPKGHIVKQQAAVLNENSFTHFVDDFLSYCKENHDREYSFEDAENILLLFFNDHLFHFLNNGTDISSLVGDSEEDELIIVSAFIQQSLRTNPKLSELITSFAVGNLLLCTLLFRDFVPDKKEKVDCDCYLDADIIFEVIGINYEIRQKAYEEFLLMLKAAGFKLRIFMHTYDEVFDNLNRACEELSNSTGRSKFPNRTLSFFKDPVNNFAEVDARQFIANAKSKIQELGIDIWPTPSPNENRKHQIDVDELEKRIIDRYSLGKDSFEVSNRLLEMIRLDEKSIAALFKLRKYNKPKNFAELKVVMVTTNQSLVKVAIDTQHEENNYSNTIIPVLVSDLTIGSIVWLSTVPEQVEEFAKAKVISKIISIMEPSEDLLDALSEEVNKAITKKTLSENQASMLFEDMESRKLLTIMTLGNIERVREHTPHELLEIRTEEITKPVRAKLEEKTEKLRIAEIKSEEKDGIIIEQEKLIRKQETGLRNTVYVHTFFATFLSLIIPFGILILFTLQEQGVKVIKSTGVLGILDWFGLCLNLIMAFTGLALIPILLRIYDAYFRRFCHKLQINYETPKLVLAWRKLTSWLSFEKPEEDSNDQNE